MAHQLSSYIEPILKQLNAEASYLLYVIPVATILAFGLLIYAFGFKKVKLPEDAASADQTKKGKSKGPKAKSKSKGSSPQQSVVKSNGSLNAQPQKQQLPAKPKAVVQPIKRDKVVEKTKKNQVKEKTDIEIDSTADLDSGDWVTVTSKKAAKSQEKQLAKKEKKEKLKEAKSVTNESTIKVTNLMVDEEPTVATLESIWTGGEEEPLEFEDTRALKKKQPSKKSKEKVAAKKQAEAEAVVLAEPQRKTSEDKLTSTVIASYDSVPEQKSRKKSDSKKPEVAKVDSKKASKKSDVKAPVEAKSQKADPGNRPVAPKASPAPEVAPVVPKPPSNKVERPLAAPAPAPSSSTDITDGTY